MSRLLKLEAGKGALDSAHPLNVGGIGETGSGGESAAGAGGRSIIGGGTRYTIHHLSKWIFDPHDVRC